MPIPTHYLRPNKSGALPQQIVCLSVVPISLGSPPEKNRYADVCAAWSCCSYRYRNSKDTEPDYANGDRSGAFWQYLDCLLTAERVTWLFCYKLGTALHLLDFWSRVDLGLVDLTSTVRDSAGRHCDSRTKQQNAIVCTDDPPAIFRWYRPGDQATCIMVDSRNYWPDWSPSDLATAPKHYHDGSNQELDSDSARRLATARSAETQATLARYIEFVRQNDFGMFRFTAAGQAKAAFRHRFMTHKILVHQSPDARRIERAGYYGGQTEVYQLGLVRGPLYKVDVNAMYPSIMAEKELPHTILDYKVDNGNECRLSPMVPIDRAIATVTINTEIQTFPVRTDHGVAFAKGYYKTTLAGPELCRAYFAGNIVAWHDWCFYDIGPICREFSCTLWNLRNDYRVAGDFERAAWCKLISNSLYGKFGQMLPVWAELIGKTGYPRWGKQYVVRPESREIRTLRTIGGQLYQLTSKHEHPDAVPSIAAFITAHAREKMRRLREVAGQENCFYQVCDCLLVNAAGYERLRASEKFCDNTMGALRLVEEYQEADILGPNCYRLDDSWITAGISQKVIHRDGRCVTSLVEENIDGTIESKPIDTHFTFVRSHNIKLSRGILYSTETGRVATPIIDQRDTIIQIA